MCAVHAIDMRNDACDITAFVDAMSVRNSTKLVKSAAVSNCDCNDREHLQRKNVDRKTCREQLRDKFGNHVGLGVMREDYQSHAIGIGT